MPADRCLILNADDFGMCSSVNTAIQQALQAGLIRSTTLMAPCPSAAPAMRYLAEHPQTSFGVHLTATCDSPGYRWCPLSAPEAVPSLVDSAGFFYTFDQMPAFLAQVRLDELELEFRAQIEAVLSAGLHPDHLDWHALRIGGRPDIIDLMVRLAREYGLALRVMGRATIQRLQSLGLPTIDYDFLDSYLIETSGKPEQYARLLKELPPGLGEWAIHPGLDNNELRAIDPGAAVRQADLDFWTSPRAREVIETEGIRLIDYRALQPAWRSGG